MSKRDLPIVFGTLTSKNVEQLRKLNAATFPVRYNDKFYNDLVESTEWTKLAMHNEIVVGAIGARVEAGKGGEGSKVYIMTLGVLAPYRKAGIGSKLLEELLETASKHSEVTEVYLHAHVGSDAIAFYSRYGFEQGETVENYYKRIDPPHAVLLRKKINTPPQ